jgi:hypothetical protein
MAIHIVFNTISEEDVVCSEIKGGGGPWYWTSPATPVASKFFIKEDRHLLCSMRMASVLLEKSSGG